MREKFIELPQGHIIVTEQNWFRPDRIKSGKVTGSRYFIETDPEDEECVFIGRRKDGAYVGYQMVELSVEQLEKIRTKKQVDLLAREILSFAPEFIEDDIEVDEEGKRFLEEEMKEMQAVSRELQRQREGLLHPFQKRQPDNKVLARHAQMWNYRNVKNGQLKLRFK